MDDARMEVVMGLIMHGGNAKQRARLSKPFNLRRKANLMKLRVH